MIDEIWIPICNHEDFEISNFGNVRKIKNKSFVRLYTRSQGYLFVRFSKFSEQSVHRLVALAFLANPDNKPVVNHKNFNKRDNRVENLEWMTQKENLIHWQYAKKNGIYKIYKYDTKTIPGQDSLFYLWADIFKDEKAVIAPLDGLIDEVELQYADY